MVLIMRAAFLLFVIVIVGCTSSVDGAGEARSECADTFSGKWSITDTLDAKSAGCSNVPDSTQSNAFIDAKISQWDDTPEPENGTHAYFTQISAGDLAGKKCALLVATRSYAQDSNFTIDEKRTLTPKAEDPSILGGGYEFNVYKTSDYNAGKKTAAVCSIRWITSAARR